MRATAEQCPKPRRDQLARNTQETPTRLTANTPGNNIQPGRTSWSTDMPTRMEKVAEDVALAAIRNASTAAAVLLPAEKLQESFRAAWPTGESRTPINDAMNAVRQRNDRRRPSAGQGDLEGPDGRRLEQGSHRNRHRVLSRPPGKVSSKDNPWKAWKFSRTP